MLLQIEASPQSRYREKETDKISVPAAQRQVTVSLLPASYQPPSPSLSQDGRHQEEREDNRGHAGHCGDRKQTELGASTKQIIYKKSSRRSPEGRWCEPFKL